MQFFLSVGLPTAGGIWLDRKLKTVAVFTIVGLCLGFVAGVYSIYGEIYGQGKRPGGAPGIKRKQSGDDKKHE